MSRDLTHSSVCVVGGAGFLGSHMVEYLLKEKHCKVLVVDNLISGRREFVPKEARFEHADITGSENYLRSLFEFHGVDYVFNYAAEPYIPVSFERPLHVFNTNATGALQVINAADEAGVRGILQVSSAEIYGSVGDGLPSAAMPTTSIHEEDPVQPHSSYGAAKAAIDFMCQARFKEDGLPILVLRQFNCVGERETHPYVIPEIISQIHRSHLSRNDYSITVRLGNNSSRDFLYAQDAVRMACGLMERGEFGQVYNLGSESSIRIYDLASKIGTLMGFPSVEVKSDKSRMRPWEIWHLQSDNSKLYDTITERPRVPFEEALRRTILYYQENGHRWIWE